MVAAERRHADAQLGLGRVALAEHHPRAGGQLGGGRETGHGAVAGPEGVRDELHRLVVTEIAGDGDDRVGRPVRDAPEVADGRAGERPDPLLVPADLAPERPLPEERALEQGLAVLARVVEVRADLLDDHRPLALDLVAVELRPDDELPEDVDASGRLAPRAREPSTRSTRDRSRR